MKRRANGNQRKRRKRWLAIKMGLPKEMCLCSYCKCFLQRWRSTGVQPDNAGTLDHRVPLSRGGVDHYQNYLLACRKCNMDKGSLTEIEYRELREKRNAAS